MANRDSNMQPESHQNQRTVLEKLSAELERAEIDQQFAAMVEDEAYQTLQIEMTESFEESDWEALLLEEARQPPAVSEDTNN